MKRLLIFELNEFNPELLEFGAKSLNLPHLQKAISWKKTTTVTDDAFESGFLEPWSQWVSIHTGRPASDHQIKHLGDVPNLKDSEQIWERLGKYGVKTGIWGVMNGSRGNAPHNLFFVPDPWTFSEQAHPRKLNSFLGILRYAAQNYTKLSASKVLYHSWEFTRFLLKEANLFFVAKESARFVASVLRFGPKSFTIFTFFEMLSAHFYMKFRKFSQPDFSIVFFNTLAHLQHHYWTNGPLGLTPQLEFGLRSVDRALGMIFSQLGSKDAVLLMNGFSQMNTNHEEAWILYRPKSPAGFLSEAGISFERIEQLMTYDAHVFFRTEEEMQLGATALENATANGKPLFYVEKDSFNKKKLFFRVDFSNEASSDAVCKVNGREFQFHDQFVTLARRTGRHQQSGVIYHHNFELPDSISNHKLFDSICSFYQIPIAGAVKPSPALKLVHGSADR